MISMLGQDDEIDLVFHAMSKRIKTNLTDEETEDLMEELNSVVTKHVRQARAKIISHKELSHPLLHLLLLHLLLPQR